MWSCGVKFGSGRGRRHGGCSVRHPPDDDRDPTAGHLRREVGADDDRCGQVGAADEDDHTPGYQAGPDRAARGHVDGRPHHSAQRGTKQEHCSQGRQRPGSHAHSRQDRRSDDLDGADGRPEGASQEELSRG